MSGERNLGLDFMRMLAISLVLFGHAAPLVDPYIAGWTLSGFYVSWGAGVLGVEIFFCLSGFLIGSILLDIQQSGEALSDLKIFMVRRWMRTLPLYYVTLAVLIMVPVLDPSARERLWSYALLSQNLVTPMPDSNWFGVSWSLVIEEWSYFLLPLVAFGALRHCRHPVGCSAISICAAAFLMRIVHLLAGGAWNPAVRDMMLLRLDAIGYGVLLAWALRCSGPLFMRWSIWVSPVGAMMFITRVHALGNPWRMNGFFERIFGLAVLAVSICALLPLMMRLRLPRLLSAPIRFMARISYSLYLVHWPMLYVSAHAAPLWQLPIFLVATFVVSALVSYGIEQPIMRLRPRGPLLTAQPQPIG